MKKKWNLSQYVNICPSPNTRMENSNWSPKITIITRVKSVGIFYSMSMSSSYMLYWRWSKKTCTLLSPPPPPTKKNSCHRCLLNVVSFLLLFYFIFLHMLVQLKICNLVRYKAWTFWLVHRCPVTSLKKVNSISPANCPY